MKLLILCTAILGIAFAPAAEQMLSESRVRRPQSLERRERLAEMAANK